MTNTEQGSKIMDYIVTNIETGVSDIIEATPETIDAKVEDIAIDSSYHLENFRWGKAEDNLELYNSLKNE